MRNEDSSGDPFATGGLDTRRDPTDYTSPTHDSRDDDSVDPPVSTTGGFGPIRTVVINDYSFPRTLGKNTGAMGLIDEGTEAINVAKRVTSILRAAGIITNYIEDNVSKVPGTHNKGIGTETLIYSGKNIDTATAITDAISNASGLQNRGVKIRTDLGLLKGTNKPCYLIEVCFVNDSVDVSMYKRDFEKICQAIAGQLAKAVGKMLKPSTSSTVEDKGRNLIRKAVADGTFTSPHTDVDNYSTEKILEYALIYIERKVKYKSKPVINVQITVMTGFFAFTYLITEVSLKVHHKKVSKIPL
ncbi:N-acetylmuramoyl-L-alanine amidase [Lysinibacillus sp. MHQ-1]|nr:N-acetylmuramoyl-L-alanine amidase [Lysinibacillus sp. MHQ-1]